MSAKKWREVVLYPRKPATLGTTNAVAIKPNPTITQTQIITSHSKRSTTINSIMADNIGNDTPTIYCEATSITGNSYIFNLIQKPATTKGDGSPLGPRRETATHGPFINFAALSNVIP